MAISKTTINGDLSVLKTFLEDSGLFDSVTLASNTITCKDADDNTLFKIEAIEYGHTVTAYASASVYESVTYEVRIGGANAAPKYAYKCANGVMIDYHSDRSTADKACIIITKTNNNKIAIIFSSAISQSATAFTSFYSVAWGDVAPISSVSFTSNTQNQTVIVPFTTNNDLGVSSYTPNAGFVLFGQYYSSGYGSLYMSGDVWLTNGYWCVRDGAAS